MPTPTTADGATFDLVAGAPGDKGAILKKRTVTLADLTSILRKAQAVDPGFSFDELCAARERARATKGTAEHASAKARLDALKATPWFCATTFAGDRRDGKELQSVTAFVGDADQPGTSREGLITALEALGSAHVVATSTSHGCEGQPRYRVIVPLAEPLTGAPDQIRARYKALWLFFHARLGGTLDPGAKDATRLNYTPRIPWRATGHEVLCVADLPWFDATTVPQEAIVAASVVVERDQRRTEITAEQLAHLKSALAHPALLACAENRNVWIEVGLSLLSLGQTGLELFAVFCRAAPNYQEGDELKWWHHNATQIPRADFRHVFTMAQGRGWLNPGSSPRARLASPEDFVLERSDVQRGELVPEPTGHTAPLKERSAAKMLGLMTNDKGAPLSNAANAERATEQLLHGSLTYDEFLGRLMVRWPELPAARPWKDEDTTRLQIWLQKLGMITMSAASAIGAAELVASRHPSNVVVDWLIGLQWDGTRRLSLLLPRGFGTPADRYHVRAGRNMLLAMVARALQPGCQVDEALVFEGSQGTLKSSALRVLGGEHFAELTADPNSKDFEQQLRGVWLGEFAELNALRRADDIARLKQFITNRIDHYRPSYGRATVDLPRQVVFCGTTNEDCWVHDPTGARRFIPISAAKIDLPWLRDNRNQLFAEAVALLKTGRKWWLFPRAETLAKQEARRPADPWERRIYQYLFGRPEIADISELLDCAVGVPVHQQTHAQATRAGTILKKLGCVQQNQRRVSGRRSRPWSVLKEFSGARLTVNGPVELEATKPALVTDPELVALLGDILGVTV